MNIGWGKGDESTDKPDTQGLLVSVDGSELQSLSPESEQNLCAAEHRKFEEATA